MAGLPATVAPAHATVFENPTGLSITDATCSVGPGQANLYPSTISVSALLGTIADVNVRLNGMTHAFEGDYELLLVGPGGGAQNLVLLSDAGTGALQGSSVTFDDAAPASLPRNTSWGGGVGSTVNAKPTDYLELVLPSNPADAYPSVPAPVNHPAPTGAATLASAFNGTNANGTWSLFVLDDGCSDTGGISGGWSLDITTNAALPTTTSLISSVNPAATGQPITFTATVTADGSAVSGGTVSFTEGATMLAVNVPLSANGQAGFTTSALSEGNHIITATYNGTGLFATSNGSVNQRLDNNTTVSGSQYCNTGPLAIGPLPTVAAPYPSNILISAGPAFLDKVTVTLNNVAHFSPQDIEALLVGPGGQNLVLVSDAGGSGPGTPGANNVTVRFDDAAAGQIPQFGPWGPPSSAVSSKPVDYSELAPDVFPPPAPPPSAATTLSSFHGTNPNGTWSLYVVSDGAPDAGSVIGGWCITVTPVVPTPIAIFRPSIGTWLVKGGATTAWGTSGDFTVPGDYDGNGSSEVAVFRRSIGTWFVKGGAATAWGTTGDIPVPGDYDGNGSTDIAVFRPSNGTWFIRGGPATNWGTSGDIPVPDDYDGNGTTDLAVFRPATGAWYVQGGPATSWGISGDVPVSGDYDGNGAAEVAVFRPSTGIWYVQGGAAAAWGTNGDIPVPGDYDGNGRTEIAVFRPSSGFWYLPSGFIVSWGISGDVPVPLPAPLQPVFFP